MRPELVLEHMRRQPRGRTSFKNMVRTLRLKGKDRAALQDALDGMVEQGRIVEKRRGHYKLAEAGAGYVAGRFFAHPAGYGFVQPDRPIPGIEGDVFIPPPATAGAMHQDRVLAKLVRVGADGRAEGRIQRILTRAQTEVVGLFRYFPRGSYVVPHDERVQGQIEILPGQELPPPEARGERLGLVEPPPVTTARELDGMIVTVEVLDFPTRLEPARGRVIEALGRPGDFGVDVETTIRKHHLPYRFSAEALAEAEAVPAEIDPAEIERRRDFRELPVVTIDGETARDFDDAVYVEQLDNGRYALQVHIADVSHYVRPGSALDREANLRGNSAYFPDRAIPMLPARLSTGVCSLNPHVDRLTLSALLEVDARGEVKRAEFTPGVIRSAERMTYTNVFRVLDRDPEASERYRDQAPHFRLMQEVAEILIAKRRRRGAIDLDIPEPEILFDEQGRMSGVRRSERNIAHRIIEEFMLAANEAVAHRIEQAGWLSLHRIHEKPTPKALLEFESVARSFGHSLGMEGGAKRFGRSRRGRDGSKRYRETTVAGDIEISSRDFQRLAEAIRGRPEERVLNYRMLRAMKQARYSEEARGHFALAVGEYTHFTSPIRRYPDLVVHRILRALLASGKASAYGPDSRGPLPAEALAQIADHTSVTERRAADAERELLDWKRAKFMEERLGDEFEGLVVAVSEAGLWVELTGLFVEGLVPAESFPRERFYYHENRRALVGARTKAKYTLGDRVRVRVDRIAWDRLRPEFSCLGRVSGAQEGV